MTGIEIARIRRGLAAQRLVTLFDDRPIAIAQDAFRTHETSEPRWLHAREAKWEGQCDDGRKAPFRYGSGATEMPPGRTKRLGISTLWGPWTKKTWQDTPVGVVLQ